MTAPASPTLEATTSNSQASRASSPHAPRFLSTLSPRKSAASTTTVSVTAAPRSQGQQDDAVATGGASMSRSTSIESSVNGLPQSPSEDLSLSMRIGSAMNAQFPTLASLEAAPAATVSASDSQAKGEVDKGQAVQRGHVSTSQESTQPPAEEQQAAQPSSSTSPWTWTSRAATGSMSFFKQGADAAATGLGSALRTNPFRSLSGAFAGEEASPSSSQAAPEASTPASTNKAGPASGLPGSSSRRTAASVAAETQDDDDDDDVNAVRSAADSLRIGAKNEERRRRRVQEHARSQERRQQSSKAANASKSSSSMERGGSSSGVGGTASNLFASAGSFLLPLRRESPSTSRSASPAPPVPPAPPPTSNSSATSSSLAPSDINYFDFPTTWPEAERPPSPTSPLPSRRYFVLTQAGKPVFLSHLAQRRLAREDAARARLRAAREAQRRREERLADTAVSMTQEERQGLLDEEERARLSEEEARSLEAKEADHDEEEAAIQVGVLQALVSNFSSHGTEHLEAKSIEILDLPSGSSRVIFLLREPLYLAVTSTWHGAGYLYSDAETTLRGHLEVLYSGILSLISEAQLKRLFARGHNFDLRRMLEGTDGIVESLVARLQTDFGLSLGAGGGGVCLRPMRVDLKLREDLTACLSLEGWERRPLGKALAAAAAAAAAQAADQESASFSSKPRSANQPLDPTSLLSTRMPPRPKDLIYVLLITPDLELVTLVRPRRLSAYPLDLHLLINMVAGMSRRGRGQREAGTVNWVPICLPRFAPQGMVQAHISWLGAGSGATSTSTSNGDGSAAAANGEKPASGHNRAGSSSSTMSQQQQQRTSTASSPCALVIVTADRESFDEISRYRDYILSLLSLPSTTTAPRPTSSSSSSSPPTPPSPLRSLHLSTPLTRIGPDSLHLPGLWHFVLKKKDDLQVVWSEWLAEGYAGEGREAVLARERVTRAYERVREVCVLRAKERRRGGEKGRRRRREKEEKEKQVAVEAAAGGGGGAAATGKEGETSVPQGEDAGDKEGGQVPSIVVDGGGEEDDEDDDALRPAASTPVDGDQDEGEGEDGEDASNGDAAGTEPPATSDTATSSFSPSSLLPAPPPPPLLPPSSSISTSTSATSSSSSSSSYAYYLRTAHEAIYVDCPPSSSFSTITSSSSPVSSPYEIYLTLSPHVPPATAKRIARAVLLWGLWEGSSSSSAAAAAAAERAGAGGGEGGGGGGGGPVRGERWRLWLGRGGSVV